MVEQVSAKKLQPHEAHLILSLRLLIARAANTDSLHWWDDEALTASGGFLLERLFPVVPPLAARSLAIRAAQTRHQAACEAYPQAVHLYRLDLDNLDKLALRREPLLPIPMPGEPITTMDALRQNLLAFINEPPRYRVIRRTSTNLLQIDISPPANGESLLLHRARTLAWAYLEGASKQAVFPCIVEA